jgi:hypothetical protein
MSRKRKVSMSYAFIPNAHALWENPGYSRGRRDLPCTGTRVHRRSFMTNMTNQ